MTNLTASQVKDQLIKIIDDPETADTELLRCVKALHKEDSQYTIDKLNDMYRNGQKTVVVLCELLKLTPKEMVRLGEGELDVSICK